METSQFCVMTMTKNEDVLRLLLHLTALLQHLIWWYLPPKLNTIILQKMRFKYLGTEYQNMKNQGYTRLR